MIMQRLRALSFTLALTTGCYDHIMPNETTDLDSGVLADISKRFCEAHAELSRQRQNFETATKNYTTAQTATAEANRKFEEVHAELTEYINSLK